MPVTQPYPYSSQHTYAFAASGVGFSGITYVFNSIFGCGTSGGMTGTLTTPASNCNITAVYTSTTTTATTTSTVTTTILPHTCAAGNPAFTDYGSLDPDTNNWQVGPGNTLATDGSYGFIVTADYSTANNEGANWTWDFGSARSGTFNAIWYASRRQGADGDCPGGYTNFAQTWYDQLQGLPG